MKQSTLDKSMKAIKDHFDNMTPEQIEEARELFKDDAPEGWVSIEDHLPKWKARDLAQGYSEYRVKNKDGSRYNSRVTDHGFWYQYAKDVGITHWLNE